MTRSRSRSQTPKVGDLSIASNAVGKQKEKTTKGKVMVNFVEEDNDVVMMAQGDENEFISNEEESEWSQGEDSIVNNKESTEPSQTESDAEIEQEQSQPQPSTSGEGQTKPSFDVRPSQILK